MSTMSICIRLSPWGLAPQQSIPPGWTQLMARLTAESEHIALTAILTTGSRVPLLVRLS